MTASEPTEARTVPAVRCFASAAIAVLCVVVVTELIGQFIGWPGWSSGASIAVAAAGGLVTGVMAPTASRPSPGGG